MLAALMQVPILLWGLWSWSGPHKCSVAIPSLRETHKTQKVYKTHKTQEDPKTYKISKFPLQS